MKVSKRVYSDYLIGQYRHSIDLKNRLFIPPKFRDILRRQLQRHFFLTSGLDGCLYLYLPEQWEKILRDKIGSLNSSDKGMERAFKRRFFSEAQEASLDSHGRILIPQFLKDYARLSKEVCIQGVGTRIEIWNAKLWERYCRERIRPSLQHFAKEFEI